MAIRLSSLTGAVLLLPAAIYAQDVISARAGLIHHADGQVLLNEKPLAHKAAQFQEVKESEYLRTERGRAEVLLTPGVFLRLGEDTQVQMLSSRLSDVRLRLLSGSAVIEADEIEKSNSITAVVRDSEVHLLRSGLYRLDAVEEESPRLRVLNGEALVTTPGGEFRLKSKKEIELAGDPQARKFDPEDTDALDRWSKRRASYLSVANLSASRMAYRSGLSYSSSSWMWSPFFGMFTYLPYRDVIWSPYGYGFYSPRAVYYLYNPPRNNTAIQSASRGPAYNSTYGYNTVGQTSTGNSGVLASSPSSPVSRGGAAPVSRGGGTGGGAARR